jgi:hypothetical protein
MLTSMRASNSLTLLVSLLLVAACTGVPPPIPADQIVVPGSAVSTAVNEYFHHRKLAIVARDADVLWARYPQLRTGEDLSTGVNTEGWLATRSDTSRSLDVVYDLDRYERLRLLTSSADTVVVRVHGLERYIQKDFSDGTAGGFILDLHLQRAGDRWTVVRTDEMTLSEFHKASP